MRGPWERSSELFAYVSMEERIPLTHPLRRIRPLADQALPQLNGVFGVTHARKVRPSVPLNNWCWLPRHPRLSLFPPPEPPDPPHPPNPRRSRARSSPGPG